MQVIGEPVQAEISATKSYNYANISKTLVYECSFLSIVQWKWTKTLVALSSRLYMA